MAWVNPYEDCYYVTWDKVTFCDPLIDVIPGFSQSFGVNSSIGLLQNIKFSVFVF